LQDIAKLREAETARQELLSLVERQPGRVPLRLWEAIVAYANADPPEETLKQKIAFLTMLTESVGWIGGVLDDLKQCDDAQGQDIVAVVESRVLEERYRPEIKRVLTYLAAPDRYGNLAAQAAEFLRQHGTEIKMHIGSSGFNPEDGLLISEYWPERIGSVVSPVCKFILDQIERHDEGREPLREVIPIGLCDRPGCGRFRIVKKQRKGNVFCSDLCRANFSQANKSKEEKAADMRDYRATVKERRAKKKGRK
jgi:hypothetical protein